MQQEIQTILEDNEKVIKEQKQDLKSAMAFGILLMLIIAIFAYIFQSILLNPESTCLINGQPSSHEECAKGTIYIVFFIYLFALVIPTLFYLNYKVTTYIVTNKRLIVKSGLIGADIRSIYYDQIKSIFVNVGLIGKIFSTGTIMIDTGRISQDNAKTVYDRFSNIKTPYKTYKTIQDFLSNRKESLKSGRADFENNNSKYKEFIQETEKMKKEV